MFQTRKGSSRSRIAGRTPADGDLLIQHQTLDSARKDPAARRDVRKPQFVGSVTELMLPVAGQPAPRPQAFLVEQSPLWQLPIHFHLEHQFQVFVAGGGSIGRQPIRLLDVHYASPHSGYGPLVSGDAGVSYLTLRAVGDTGAWYLPEMRDKCLRIPKVQAHGSTQRPVSAQALREMDEPGVETLIEPHPGGLAAWVVRLGRGGRCPQPPGAENGGGRFLVATQGSLALSDSTLQALAVAWVGAGDRLDLVAGDDGLEVAVLQFPAEAARSFVEAQAALAQP
jgi:hypothetical protein